MRGYTFRFPTLLKTVTCVEEFTEEDYASTRILYLVDARYIGIRAAKNHSLRILTKNMLCAAMNGERFLQTHLSNSFQWGTGLSESLREEMHVKGINIVRASPGYGPFANSHFVRDCVSISSLISLVTTMEYLVEQLSTVDVWEFPRVENNFMFYVKSLVSDMLYELERLHYITRKGTFNVYKLESNDVCVFVLTIGHLSVKVQKDGNEIRITYDAQTKRMVRDNYGDDYVYA